MTTKSPLVKYSYSQCLLASFDLTTFEEVAELVTWLRMPHGLAVNVHIGCLLTIPYERSEPDIEASYSLIFLSRTGHP